MLKCLKLNHIKFNIDKIFERNKGEVGCILKIKYDKILRFIVYMNSDVIIYKLTMGSITKQYTQSIYFECLL